DSTKGIYEDKIHLTARAGHPALARLVFNQFSVAKVTIEKKKAADVEKIDTTYSIENNKVTTAAKKFITNSQTETNKITQDVLGIFQGDGSNICGVLSVQILKEAGLIDQRVDPKNYWLLNPFIKSGEERLVSIFPKDKYTWDIFSQNIGSFDFKTYKLKAGDFLYLTGGTFDHIVTISRVDEKGRVYAVTNLKNGFITGNTDDKNFVIQEVLLYDSENPTLGMFYKWSDISNTKLGNTGASEFRIWSRKITVSDVEVSNKDASQVRINQISSTQTDIEKYYKDHESDGKYAVWFQNENGETIAVNADTPMQSWSLVKVPIAILVLQLAQQDSKLLDKPISLFYSNSKTPIPNTDGSPREISIRNAIYQALNYSDNDANWSLSVFLKSQGVDILSEFRTLGLNSTVYDTSEGQYMFTAREYGQMMTNF
ncbi:MAG: serine hydrolase, partial [Patescibacteria group bacterium]